MAKRVTWSHHNIALQLLNANLDAEHATAEDLKERNKAFCWCPWVLDFRQSFAAMAF